MTINIAQYIEILIQYGLGHELLDEEDVPQVRNQLMDLLKIDEPYQGDSEQINVESLTDILEGLINESINKGLIASTITEKDLLDSKIMAQLLPRQSELIRKYHDIIEDSGIKAATDFFYQLSIDSNYIRMNRIKKNLHWIAETEYGDLEITINLSKPEKDPADIAAEKTMPKLNYPKCLLCLENVGYPGRLNHPGRSNHRVIPLTLEGEKWYLQYSPYVYYNEHAIIFSESHRPMTISKNTFIRLLDFVEQYPHYFIGSNAELPIVGGSILSHDHFQGGRHVFPMEKASIIHTYRNENFPHTEIHMIKWPLSVIRLSSNSKDELIELANKILELWRQYSDEEVDILSHSDNTPHNTITPIARMNEKKQWELDLTLRNNRVNEKHPHGIFHPHTHLHHIKKENIGLIEVMGLAVLPPRLEEEILVIQNILSGLVDIEKALEIEAIEKHEKWINELSGKYGTSLNAQAARIVIREEVGDKFKQVLECAGVFKQDKKGFNAFEKFILQCTKLTNE